MYVTTFYSFKGGVGRTLALANVGLELARTGRRVLLVDFDLEAPGIHTFNHMKPKQPQEGLVDYITDYIANRSAPDVRNFVYENMEAGRNDGHLFIMPAGKNDLDYSQKLSEINWQKLYREQDGFLMFEDMKEQWKKSLDVDYVLIDSRTGHTDIGGICTRQLPDAVVVLFFPNEQNLTGLKPVISSIRSEDKKTGRTTQLHFVMSNVPDLDDENEILANLEERFQDELNYSSLTCTIHRYDSLSLLQQSLFIAERPKSRLAKEYQRLLEEITEYNIEDRESVLRTLNKKNRHPLFTDKKQLVNEEERINDIAKLHHRDGELLYLSAMDLKRLGRLKKYETLLAKSIECGFTSPEALLERAGIRQKDGDTKGAADDLWLAFSYDNLDREQLGRAIEILRRINPEKLLDIVNTPAFSSLSADECLWIVSELNWCKPGLQTSVNLLTPHYSDQNINRNETESIKQQLILSSIGLSKFSDAIELFGTTRPAPSEFDIQDCFNYAMAEWGKNGSPPLDMFEHVCKLALQQPSFPVANYYQCLALSHWVLGQEDKALQSLEGAVAMIIESPNAEFSCWRYMSVTPTEFREDCTQIQKMLEGHDVRPAIFCS